jgi:RNA polymerase sigma-70 factor, ECF subfamily
MKATQKTSRRLKDEDEAADVAQDALLNAYRHRASFRGDSRFTTWLYRVAATTALMHLRKKRRARAAFPAPEPMGETDPADLTAELPAHGPSPEDSAAAHEALQIAGKRLSALGDKYGPIFKMRFADGYSESEIADELDLNVATVKTRAYRARAALREEIAQAA